MIIELKQIEVLTFALYAQVQPHRQIKPTGKSMTGRTTNIKYNRGKYGNLITLTTTHTTILRAWIYNKCRKCPIATVAMTFSNHWPTNYNKDHGPKKHFTLITSVCRQTRVTRVA